MKDSFVLLNDQRPAFDMLPDAEAGQLIKAVMAYAFDGSEPELSPVAAMAFAMLKPVLDKHAAKYEATCDARRKAGAKGGTQSGKTRGKQAEANEANASAGEANEANEANASAAKPREANEHDSDCDCECDCECERKDTPPLPPSPGGGACSSPAPLSGEGIDERRDGARAERRRGDYEFSLLRSEYDKARQEGPMAGRQEFLQLFGSPDFPGLDEILAGLQRLLEQDDQFRRGYAPGLSRFLRERMWAMRPRAPAGEKAQEETPEAQAAKKRLEELQAKLKAQKQNRRP